MEIQDLVLCIMQTCLSKEEIKTYAKRLDKLARTLKEKKKSCDTLLSNAILCVINLCVNKCDCDAR